MMDNSRNVFISYSPEDALFARKLADDLNALSNGMVYINLPLERESIAPGDSWVRYLRPSEIYYHTDTILVILSKSSAKSDFLTDEIALAFSARIEGTRLKQIIPVVAESDADIPPYLRSIQYADLSNPVAYSRNIKTLVSAVEGWTRGSPYLQEHEAERFQVVLIKAQNLALATSKARLLFERSVFSLRLYANLLIILVIAMLAPFLLVAFVLLPHELRFLLPFAILEGLLFLSVLLILSRLLKIRASPQPDREKTEGLDFLDP